MDIPFDALAEARQREIGELVLRFSSGEGMHASAVAGLHCIRLSAPYAPLPTVYRPSFCVIVQGAKQVLLEEEVYRYAPSQFLAVSVDLPLVGQVLEASADAPYLCVAIDIDARQIAELVEQGGPIGPAPRDTPRGLFVGELDEATQDTVLRLARLLATPREIPVLAPLLMREFHFRVLSGPFGASIAQMAMAGSHTHRIAQVIQHIRSQLAAPLRIEELASLAHMSRSAFHQQFKAVTAMSPLQYQKRLRLTEARQILLAEQTDAASAAYRVGYQSASQFSREYARMFGAPPIRDVACLRDSEAAITR
ncbi:MAG: AraC family transcriptional regulator [Xanthomonadales bacterium]|nr:AraC family transcriptional regulator [Xanthomonadales bacterium]